MLKRVSHSWMSKCFGLDNLNHWEWLASRCPQKKVTATALAKAIRNAQSNACYREQAQRLSAQMQRNDGVANAVALIEAQLKSVIL
jgi:hypothetical protein